jgi:mono/diheme cytochrome c family protein
MRKLVPFAAVALALVAAAPIAAQQAPAGPAAIREQEGPALQVPVQFDRAAAERGQALLGATCGFCHGANARGGAGGPDLTRSPLVQEDAKGKQLGEFLKVGRPDRGMPSFAQLSEAQVQDIAEYLHSQIFLNANRRLYTIGDILVGDPRRGEAYFNGPGRCATCHSVERDLKGIGARLDPVRLQDRIVMLRGAAQPGGPPLAAPHLDKNALLATVATPAGPVTGRLVRLSDFNVTLYDPATGAMRSFARVDGAPKVAVVDPLKGHVDQLYRWKDDDLHDVTAYLASLK